MEGENWPASQAFSAGMRLSRLVKESATTNTIRKARRLDFFPTRVTYHSFLRKLKKGGTQLTKRGEKD